MIDRLLDDHVSWDDFIQCYSIETDDSEGISETQFLDGIRSDVAVWLIEEADHFQKFKKHKEGYLR